MEQPLVLEIRQLFYVSGKQSDTSRLHNGMFEYKVTIRLLPLRQNN